MTARIAFGIFLMMAIPAQAQEDVFVYDDHGKRDPFGPLVTNSGAVVVADSDLTVTDLSLEGLVADAQGNNLAVINGKIVKAGDQIGPYRVDTIAVDHVELLKEQERITLKLKKGGT
ncbi:MAG: hypothetical protein HY591_06540 [Candidatus Omnitrophica bacterium]|nr:hypothetical protein [Candidatus Omnitrophota bacterium]